MIFAFVFVFIVCALGTLVTTAIFRFFGKRGYLGNLFPNVRGGIPRGVGLVPFIMLAFYLLSEFSDLVLIIGISAFIDDIIGRRKLKFLNLEIGQLSRGIGMILVIAVGFYYDFGLSSILIAFLIQPMNISDMQPGSCVMVTVIMSVITIICMLIAGTAPVHELPATYTPLLLLVVCLAYCPLDFMGKIMLGEVGNHVFAICLGVSFYLIGGFVSTLLLSIVTVFLIAFVRRNTLRAFFRTNLGIFNPTFGDFVMDVLTGGGLGDFLRKIILRDKQITVENDLLIKLGFRRLLYNPHALYSKVVVSDKKIPYLRKGG